MSCKSSISSRCSVRPVQRKGAKHKQDRSRCWLEDEHLYRANRQHWRIILRARHRPEGRWIRVIFPLIDQTRGSWWKVMWMRSTWRA
jgi:hypothetical protein